MKNFTKNIEIECRASGSKGGVQSPGGDAGLAIGFMAVRRKASRVVLGVRAQQMVICGFTLGTLWLH